MRLLLAVEPAALGLAASAHVTLCAALCRRRVQGINAGARVIETVQSRVEPLDLILDVRAFDLAKVLEAEPDFLDVSGSSGVRGKGRARCCGPVGSALRQEGLALREPDFLDVSGLSGVEAGWSAGRGPQGRPS